MRRLLLLAMLVAALPLAAQDIVELDGQPAMRFAVGHGHLQTYCQGELLISEARVVYRTTYADHSFDVARGAVHDAHSGGSLGFSYIKLEVDGKGTYRFGVFPDVAGRIPNRFELLVHALNDPTNTFPEVRRLLEQRRADLANIHYTTAGGGDAIAIPGGLYRGFIYLPGSKKAPVFDPPDAGYRMIRPPYTGTIIITATGVTFKGDKYEFPFQKSELKPVFMAAGFPMATYRDKDGVFAAFCFGPSNANGLELSESAPFLAAMEDQGFAKLIAALNPKAVLAMTGAPAGAQLFLNENTSGTFDNAGVLRLGDLKPGDYSVRVTKEKFIAWSGNVSLKAGETRQLQVELKPEPPKGLSEEEIEDALKNGMSPARIADKVKELGVAFALTDESENRLRKAGADDALLLVISRAKH